MSASDKKQLKKAAMAEGMTQKQHKAQKEAQAAKRKQVTYTAVGVVCAVLAIGLLFWSNWDNLTGHFNNSKVAATVDGVDYTVADLKYYYTSARQATYQTWYSLLYGYGYNTGFDYTVDDGAQWQDEANNKTYADYFRETALQYLKEDAALCAAAKAEGYTLSEEGQKTLEDEFAEIDTLCAQEGISRKTFFARRYGNGVTEEVYRRNRTNSLLASEYSNHHNEGIEVSEADIEDYYKKNTADLDSYDYRYFFIDGTAATPVDENGEPLKNEDGTTVTATEEEKAAALAAAKEKADAALAEIQAAEDKEAAFQKAALKYVSESVRGAYEANENYSLQRGVMGSTLSSSSSVYASWLKEDGRKSGDLTSVESSSGYFVVLFLNRYQDNDPTVNVRHILIRTDTTDSTEKDENGYAIPTQEARDAAKAKAQEILNEWKAGEATEESFAALAEKYSDDGRDSETEMLNAPGGLYEAVAKNQMVPSFNDWIFEKGRKAGDVDLVEYVGRYSGWHIIYFSGVAEDPQWRITAEKSTKSSMQSEWHDGLIDNCEVVEADGMKYVGSVNTAVPTPTASPAESQPVETESQPSESETAE